MEKQIKNRFEKVESRLEKLETSLKTNKLGNGKLIKCPYCRNKWISRSKAKLISCTNCGNKINTGEKVICFKCKKELDKDKAIYSHCEYFCKKCLKIFLKGEEEEISKFTSMF